MGYASLPGMIVGKTIGLNPDNGIIPIPMVAFLNKLNARLLPHRFPLSHLDEK